MSAPTAADQLKERLHLLLQTLSEQERALVQDDLAAVNETVTKATALASEVDVLVQGMEAADIALEPEDRSELQDMIKQLEHARQRTGLLLAQGLAYTRFSLDVLTGSSDIGYDNSGRGQAHAERWTPARLNVEG